MKTIQLIVAVFSTALLAGPVLAEQKTPAPGPSAQVTKVVKVAGMDKAPQVVKKVIPNYPRDLRQEGIQGVATVDMLVDSTGRVVTTELVSSTLPEFGDLALAAAKDWTFIPASAKGQAITTRVRVPFVFAMPETVAMGRR
jgi:TonB family protein